MARILIADDDPQVLQILATVLQGAGHQVLQAADGEAALALYQQQKPGIAILDVMMPRKAGQAVCVKIKREFPHAQVLLLSGIYTDAAFIAEAPGKFQNDGFLAKPFTPETLKAALAPLLAKAASAPAPAVAEEAELILSDEPSNPGTTIPKPAVPAPASPWPNRAAAPTAPTPPPIPKPAATSTPPAPSSPPAAAPSTPRPPSPPPVAAPASPPPAASQSLGPQPSFAVDGSLEKFSVVALLYRCANERLFGKISFKKDVATKDVFVRDGKLVYATSNLETDRLEHKLVGEGRITGDQYNDVQVLAKGLGGVEAALVQLKIVQPGEVFELAREQGLRLLLEVFKWMGGKYVFTQGATSPSNLSLDLPLEDLIQRGMKEAFDSDRLIKAFGGRLKAPAEKDLVRIADVEKLKLTPAEFRLSRMVDAKKSPEAIAKEWAAGDAAKELRALQVLYLMTEAGMLRFAETQETKKAAAEIEGLKAKLVQLEKGNLFEALGLTKEAQVADVKKSYFALAKQFHPDTLPTDAPAEARRLIDSIFSIISRANQTLQDPKQREAYLKELDVGGAAATAEAENIMMAEVEFQKGEFFLLKKRDIAAAEKHLAAAMKMNPKEAEHHVHWGWLVFLKNKNAAEATKHIEAGLKLRENVAVAWLFLGHIAKAKPDMEKAEKCYRKCLTFDPKNNEALSELRVIEMRRGKK